MSEYVRTSTVARRSGYHPFTIRRWCEAGEIPGARRRAPGSHWLIPAAWVEATFPVKDTAEPSKKRAVEKAA